MWINNLWHFISRTVDVSRLFVFRFFGCSSVLVRLPTPTTPTTPTTTTTPTTGKPVSLLMVGPAACTFISWVSDIKKPWADAGIMGKMAPTLRPARACVQEWDWKDGTEKGVWLFAREKERGFETRWDNERERVWERERETWNGKRNTNPWLQREQSYSKQQIETAKQ